MPWSAEPPTQPTAADNGYDYPRPPAVTARPMHRPGSRAEASTPVSAWVGARCKIEGTLVWLTGYHRLTIRYERHGEPFVGFLQLAAALTCRNKLAK